MGNASSHGVAFGVGSVFGSAVLAILVSTLHIDVGMATNYMIVGGGILGGPVLAYLSVKYKNDPAVTAALSAITTLAHQQQSVPQLADNGTSSTSVSATVSTAVTPAPPEPAPPSTQAPAAVVASTVAPSSADLLPH
jgi:Na+/glutamate symporter